jgi:hypothetical protein
MEHMHGHLQCAMYIGYDGEVLVILPTCCIHVSLLDSRLQPAVFRTFTAAGCWWLGMQMGGDARKLCKSIPRLSWTYMT